MNGLLMRKAFGKSLLVLLMFLVVGSSLAIAEDATPVDPITAAVDAAKEEMQNNINIVWTCVAAFLVFFMQAGFAMVEAGFTRAKNAVNILMKNLMDFSIGTIVFFLIGFSLMFGKKHGFVGWDGFGLVGSNGDPEGWSWTFLIFQTVFAGTAATIVSGAMAGRTKFKGYICYSVFICAFIYPIFGSWAWGSLYNGGGWLENMGFCDFAGSTVVHSIGGWLALAGAIILGPRIGKYGPDGKAKAIPGHNITLAALGVFILWFGWFGFNPGSTTTGNGEIGRVAVTTNLAAAAGAIVAMCVSWVIGKKPDASMSLNGALAGLVAITAPCYTVTAGGAIAIGAIAGALVYFSVIFIDNVLKIDDPVGCCFGSRCMRCFRYAFLRPVQCGSGSRYQRCQRRPVLWWRFSSVRCSVGGYRRCLSLGVRLGSGDVHHYQSHCRTACRQGRRNQGSGHRRTRYGSICRIPDFQLNVTAVTRDNL